MKITCQSCQSKYNVADDKVQGKIVKIRCRKCGATIVVNGTGGAATNGAPAAAAGDAPWHVNVTDTDQRTMTLAELVDAYNASVVTQDTFIWTDGMDDWKPLSEVEAVVNALHASAGQLAIGTPGAFEAPGLGSGEPSGAEAPAAYEPAAAPAPAYEAQAAFAAPAPEPKRAAVQRREVRGRDLFATNAGEEVQTSAPAVTSGMAPAGGPSLGGDALTGQRNENSVLFSLAVLTKDADERPAAPQESRAPGGREDSGLIDLKALAARAESINSGSAQADVFSSPIGMSPTLGAPLGPLGSMAPQAQPKSKLPLFIGGGAGVIVLLVLGVVLGMKLGGSSAAPVQSAAPVASSTATATAEPSATASAVADTVASAAPSASVAASKPARGAGGGYHPTAPGPKPAGGGATPAPGPAPGPAPKKGGDCGCNGDLMCLMKCSTH